VLRADSIDVPGCLWNDVLSIWNGGSGITGGGGGGGGCGTLMGGGCGSDGLPKACDSVMPVIVRLIENASKSAMFFCMFISSFCCAADLIKQLYRIELCTLPNVYTFFINFMLSVIYKNSSKYEYFFYGVLSD
jgi:hypothetical protein